MAVFKRLSAAEIRDGFTHYALFAGVIPVYYKYCDGGMAEVAPRNWVPEFVLDVAYRIAGFFMTMRCQLDADYEPAFPFMITGAIAHPDAY